MGELLLRDLHQRQPNSLPVLEMLALSAVRNEDTRGRGGPAGVAGPATGRDARGDRPPAGAGAAAGGQLPGGAERGVCREGGTVSPGFVGHPGKAAATGKSAPCPLSCLAALRLRGPTKGANRAPIAGSLCRPVASATRQHVGSEPDFLPTVIGFLVLSPESVSHA